MILRKIFIREIPRSPAVGFSAAVFLAAAASAGLLLYASYCAFTQYKLAASGDYIRYTNALWNTAHGEWFRYWAGEASYLGKHLSYSLALLAPLFHVWDDPFLLSVLQWLLIVAGGGLLLATGRRIGVPLLICASVLLFWVSYHFTQALQLCEFHGTVGYMILLPWLYWTLCGARRWAWLPLALLCGLREEAGLYALPLLVWFAARDRWRAGWWHAAAALAYVAVSVFWIYPAINDVPSIFSARKEIFEGVAEPAPGMWQGRAQAIAWALLPILPFARRRLVPFMILVPLPLAANLLSKWPPQYTLGIHYAANVMAALAIAMLESARRDHPRARPGAGWGTALLLVAATALSFQVRGFLLGARTELGPIYREPRLEGHNLWRFVAPHVPRGGALTSERDLQAMLANRRDLVQDRFQNPSSSRVPVSVAVCRLQRLTDEYADLLRRGEWGVRYYDGRFVVLEQGAPVEKNAELLGDFGRSVFGFGYTRSRYGSNRVDPERGLARFWQGVNSSNDYPVSTGSVVNVRAGTHRFEIWYRTEPVRGAVDRPGRIILKVKSSARNNLTNDIPLAGHGRWQLCQIDFAVTNKTRIELMVMGGANPLWLNRAIFIPHIDRVERNTGSSIGAAAETAPLTQAPVSTE